MPPVDIRKRLREIRDEERGLEARFAELRAERNPLIRQAVDRGLSQRTLAEATGLSKSRIGQIAPDRLDE